MITIISSAITAIIAAVVAVCVGEFLRKRNFTKRLQLETLHKLIAYRGNTESSEFTSAMNSLIFLFPNDKELKMLISKVRQSNSKNVQGDSIINVIERVSNLNGYSIEKEDINKFFQQ